MIVAISMIAHVYSAVTHQELGYNLKKAGVLAMLPYALMFVIASLAGVGVTSIRVGVVCAMARRRRTYVRMCVCVCVCAYSIRSYHCVEMAQRNGYAKAVWIVWIGCAHHAAQAVYRLIIFALSVMLYRRHPCLYASHCIRSKYQRAVDCVSHLCRGTQCPQSCGLRYMRSRKAIAHTVCMCVCRVPTGPLMVDVAPDHAGLVMGISNTFGFVFRDACVCVCVRLSILHSVALECCCSSLPGVFAVYMAGWLQSQTGSWDSVRDAARLLIVARDAETRSQQVFIATSCVGCVGVAAWLWLADATRLRGLPR